MEMICQLILFLFGLMVACNQSELMCNCSSDDIFATVLKFVTNSHMLHCARGYSISHSLASNWVDVLQIIFDLFYNASL